MPDTQLRFSSSSCIPSTWILSKAVIVVIVHDADLVRTEDAGIEADADLLVMEMPPPAAVASAKAVVPDFATVPMLLCPFFVIPIPKSPMVMAKFILSGAILMEWLG